MHKQYYFLMLQFTTSNEILGSHWLADMCNSRQPLAGMHVPISLCCQPRRNAGCHHAQQASKQAMVLQFITTNITTTNNILLVAKTISATYLCYPPRNVIVSSTNY